MRNFFNDLSMKHPELRNDIEFGSLDWGSLEWASFLTDLMKSIPSATHDLLLRRIFMESDFDQLTLTKLKLIVDGLV